MERPFAQDIMDDLDKSEAGTPRFLKGLNTCFPENREKIQENFAGGLMNSQISPKIHDFRNLLREGTGKEQRS